MADRCVKCGSGDTNAGFNTYKCLTCGATSNYDGTEGKSGRDQSTRDALAARDGDYTVPSVVGNYADLQRLGGQLAPESGGVADAFAIPPGVSQEEAEASARSGDDDGTEDTAPKSKSTSASGASAGTQTKAKAQ